MQLPTVELLWGNREERLVRGEANVVVPEGLVRLRLSVTHKTLMFFDDEETNPVWSLDGRTAYAQVDLTNRVGFHRIALQIGAERHNFDFETTSAKATWEEVREMARQVAQHTFAYRRQFQYALADGTRRMVPLPEVEYGWLRDRVPEICGLIDNIAHRPGTQTRWRVVTSFRGQRVAVAQTLAHLRENRHLLEEGADGPLVVDGVTYWPASVRVHVRDKEPARQEHERIAYFLRTLAASCGRLQREEVPAHTSDHLRKWSAWIASARQQPVIMRHDRPLLRSPWSPIPSMLEKVDSRYRRFRSIQAEYMMNISPGEAEADAVRTNVKDVWEIYQAYVAHIVGQALGLQYVSRRCDLRERDSLGQSMAAGEIGLYYDVHPPADILPSWRDSTDRPANERPDIIVVNYANRSVVLLDAKFRTENNQSRACNDDMREMQSYLQSFAISTGGIAFPGSGEPRFISALGNILVELPLRPSADEHEDLLLRVRQTVDSMWTRAVH